MILDVAEVEMTYRRAPGPILTDVTFSLDAGDVVPLLGANGAGKTTLLKIVSGLVHPGRGSVHVAGLDLLRDGGAARAPIGCSLYPERSFYYRLTCEQNLRCFASLLGLHGPEARRAVAEALHRLDLAPLGDTAFMRLSLGQRKRLGLARSLLADPRLLVLDEPTANLDEASAAALHEVLRTHARSGGAVLFSTHQMEDLSVSTGRYLSVAQGRVDEVRAGRGEEVTRWVDVFPADPVDVDLSDLEAEFLVRRSEDRISMALPVTISLPSLVGRLDDRGLVIEKIVDHRR